MDNIVIVEPITCLPICYFLFHAQYLRLTLDVDSTAGWLSLKADKNFVAVLFLFFICMNNPVYFSSRGL